MLEHHSWLFQPTLTSAAADQIPFNLIDLSLKIIWHCCYFHFWILFAYLFLSLHLKILSCIVCATLVTDSGVAHDLMHDFHYLSLLLVFLYYMLLNKRISCEIFHHYIFLLSIIAQFFCNMLLSVGEFCFNLHFTLHTTFHLLEEAIVFFKRKIIKAQWQFLASTVQQQSGCSLWH